MQSAILICNFCLSVCLSVALCRNRCTNRQTFSTDWYGPYVTLVFLSVKHRRRRNYCIFNRIRRLSPKRYLMCPCITIYCGALIGNHGSRFICVSSDDLEWPLKAGREGPIFRADLCTYLINSDHSGKGRDSRVIYAPSQWGSVPVLPNYWDFPTYGHTVWSRMTKFGMVTHI